MSLETVVYVPHRGTPKMVGKIFSVNGKPIFLHQARGGYHIKTDSPGGIDLLVLQALEAWNVEEIHHEDLESGTLYITSVTQMRLYGIPESSDGRDRYYLPLSAWRQCEKRRYRVPWITRQINLEYRKAS